MWSNDSDAVFEGSWGPSSVPGALGFATWTPWALVEFTLAGAYHTCGRNWTDSGTAGIACWGWEEFGQLKPPTDPGLKFVSVCDDLARSSGTSTHLTMHT